jgi:pimeloyl-ACP methyl ester carboxylesterase
MRWAMGDGRWLIYRSIILLGLFACARPYVPPVEQPAAVPVRVPTTSTAPAPVAPTRPTEGMVDGGAGKLWFHVVGRGPDTVLVPLGTWLEQGLASLGERHTVVFYDPRHRGRSHEYTDSTAATFDGDVADLEAVRNAVGASRVAVIGYDYYAAVAAAWAAANPQRLSRLVLLSPIEPADSLASVWSPPERMARIDTVAARALVKARAAGRDTSDATRYCEDFWRVNLPLFVGDTAQTRLNATTWCAVPNEMPARIATVMERVMASLGPGIDFAARAAGLQVPTLVMHGRLDLVANPEGAREWTRRINDARLLWLSNVGHLPTLEAGPMVVEAINDFLAGGWPTRAGPP